MFINCSLFAGGLGCWEIDTYIQTADISLSLLEIADISGQGRQLYSITGGPFRSRLNLVAPKGNVGDFRLIQTQRNGQRRVLSTEPVPRPVGSYGDDDLTCTPLAREVDGQVAQADLRPGFVTNTWILIVGGKKPNLNTVVNLQPLIYIRQPEYWGFNVLDCQRGDIVLPTISDYTVSLEVTGQLGTEGVEVFWASGESQRISLPKASGLK